MANAEYGFVRKGSEMKMSDFPFVIPHSAIYIPHYKVFRTLHATILPLILLAASMKYAWSVIARRRRICQTCSYNASRKSSALLAWDEPP